MDHFESQLRPQYAICDYAPGRAFMKTVTRDQFKIRSDLEVVHVPSGATFWAYPYYDPNDVLRSVTANWPSAEDQSGTVEGYTQEDIRRMAVKILLERAHRNAPKRE